MSGWASEQVRECESANVCTCPCLYVREREREEERERNVCECARKMGIKIWSPCDDSAIGMEDKGSTRDGEVNMCNRVLVRACQLSFVEMLDIRKFATSPVTTADVACICRDYGISPDATKLLVTHENLKTSLILKKLADFEAMLSRLSPAAHETELLVLRHDAVLSRSVRVRLLTDAKYISANIISSERQPDLHHVEPTKISLNAACTDLDDFLDFYDILGPPQIAGGCGVVPAVVGGFRSVPEAAAEVSQKTTLHANSGGFSSIGSYTSVTAVGGLGVGTSAIHVVAPAGAGCGFGIRTDSFPLSSHGKFGTRFSWSPCPDKSYYFSIYTHPYTLTYTHTHTHT